MRNQMTAPITNDRTNDGEPGGASTFLDAQEDNGFESYTERKLKLIEDWDTKLIRFSGSVKAGTSTAVFGEIKGPREGYSWLITRLNAAIMPIFNGTTFPIPNGFMSDILFLSVQPGQLASHAAPVIPFGGSNDILAYLQIVNLVSGAWCHQVFEEDQCLLDSERNLGYMFNISSAQSGKLFYVNGQAIELPTVDIAGFLSR